MLKTPKMARDEFISMKMLTAYKALKREQPKKPHPDVGWMNVLLEVSREAGVVFDAQEPKPPSKTAEELFNEARIACDDCFDPSNARVWANALSKP